MPSLTAAGLALPAQVSLLEDEEGRLHCRGLSTHRVNTEEEALNLVGAGGAPLAARGCAHLGSAQSSALR